MSRLSWERPVGARPAPRPLPPAPAAHPPPSPPPPRRGGGGGRRDRRHLQPPISHGVNGVKRVSSNSARGRDSPINTRQRPFHPIEADTPLTVSITAWF